MSANQPRENTGVHPAFERDVFHLRPALLTAAERHQVSDEDGTPLLTATSPPRLMRLVTAALLLTPVFLVVQFLTTMLFVASANLLQVKRELFGPLFVAGFIIGFLLASLSVIWVLSRLLSAKHFLIRGDEARDRPLLTLRPQSRFLGLGSLYEVCDEQGVLLATLRTNYVYNLFRERWQGARPDGRTWFIVAEKSAVPRVIRMAMQAGVGMLFLVALLVGPVAAIAALDAVAALGIPLLLYLAVLVLLAAFCLVVCVLAFVQRKLLPVCPIVQWDDGTVLGEFRREPDARAPNILDMNRDRGHALDRRVAIAVAVLLNKRA